MPKSRHVLSTKQFTDKDSLESIFLTADQFQKQEQKPILQNRVFATLFFEPSTRTRLSFEIAIQKLGGKLVTVENAIQCSSAVKGETLEDTIKVLNGYVDAVILRHPDIGSADQAAKFASIPIINAGDGAGEHPTQALLDIYTIKKELGSIDGQNIVLVGDLLYSRTIHSLIHLLNLYQPKHIYLVAPNQLSLPENITKQIKAPYSVTEDLTQALKIADVVYMTRVQKERFDDQKVYENLKDSYILNKKSVQTMPKNSIILHPLPRVNEISKDIDSDPRAAYFKQTKYGVYVRMAILANLFK